MKGTDIESVCAEQKSCESCSLRYKQCKKWKEDMEKLSTMEPWQLEEIITLFGEVVHNKKY